MAMAVAAVACVPATLAVFIIEPRPASTSSRELTRSVSLISRPARPGGNNEERRPTYRQKEKAHEDPNHHRRHLRRPRLLDGRPHLRP